MGILKKHCKETISRWAEMRFLGLQELIQSLFNYECYFKMLKKYIVKFLAKQGLGPYNMSSASWDSDEARKWVRIGNNLGIGEKKSGWKACLWMKNDDVTNAVDWWINLSYLKNDEVDWWIYSNCLIWEWKAACGGKDRPLNIYSTIWKNAPLTIIFGSQGRFRSFVSNQSSSQFQQNQICKAPLP